MVLTNKVSSAICECCGNEFEVDTDACMRCGAQRPAWQRSDGYSVWDYVRALRHLQPRRRTRVRVRYRLVQDDLGLKSKSQHRRRKLGWRLFMAAAVICALAVAAAYTTKARRSEPGTVAVGANASGATSPPASDDGPVWREARRSSSSRATSTAPSCVGQSA